MKDEAAGDGGDVKMDDAEKEEAAKKAAEAANLEAIKKKAA